jgi:hypothetical protein
MNTGPQENLGDGSDQSLQQVHANLLLNKPEPKDGYPVMPLFLLGLLSALVFVGSIYFLHYRGGLSSMVYDERFDPNTAEKSSAVAQVDPVAAGKRLYNQPGACVTCHQANGMGVPGAFGEGSGFNWNDEKVAYVLTYIRQEWGNTASPVEKSKVTEIRTKTAAGRNKPWIASELEALP